MALLLLKIMIQSFLCKETESLFNRFFTRKLPSDIHRTALRKLIILDSAESLIDLKVPPSNRLEKLLGDRKGQYSIPSMNDGEYVSNDSVRILMMLRLLIPISKEKKL